jgi:hypothetical protein
MTFEGHQDNLLDQFDFDSFLHNTDDGTAGGMGGFDGGNFAGFGDGVEAGTGESS